MELIFTVFMMLSGQPFPVVMDYADLGDVTIEECQASGRTMGMALMSTQPQCRAAVCYTLTRCRDTTEPSEPGEAT